VCIEPFSDTSIISGLLFKQAMCTVPLDYVYVIVTMFVVEVNSLEELCYCKNN
jgi:hypothetical protein